MLEDVLDFGKRRLFVEKLFALERGEQAIQFLFGLGDDLADQTQRELAPNDRELLQQGFLFRREAVNAGGEDALHGGGRYAGRWVVARPCRCPYAVTASTPCSTNVLHHLFHEERRAFGLLQNELFEVL